MMGLLYPSTRWLGESRLAMPRASLGEELPEYPAVHVGGHVEPERVEQMISGIVRRLESLGETDIPSKTVGEIVMESLARIDTVAYVRFASVYRSFEDVNAFREEIERLERLTG